MLHFALVALLEYFIRANASFLAQTIILLDKTVLTHRLLFVRSVQAAV
jgi:hypothetical protein